MNTSESVQATQFEELFVFVRDAKVTSYATIASLALLLFDYALTFAQEVDLVWKRRPSWGGTFFLMTRYFGICSHIFNTGVYLNNTANSDLFILYTFSRSSNGVLWSVEFSLALRVWLLYNRSYTILLSLGILYLCSITTVTVICVKALLHQTLIPRPGPFLFGCYGEIPSQFFNVLIPPAVTTSVLLALTVYKSLRTMKDVGSRKLPMVILLLRDGIFYFTAVFGVLIVNILIFHLARATLVSLASGFFVAVPCMIGSRLFLNIRQTLLHPNPTLLSLSTIEMRPCGPSIEITDQDHSQSSATSPQTQNKPYSATTLVEKNTPWRESFEGDLYVKEV